jgi:hypothetical protein
MSGVVLGFTGTSGDVTALQESWLRHYLARDDIGEVHHGACVGADVLCHRLALRAGKRIVVHPPTDMKKVAMECLRPHPLVTVLEPKEYLVRDDDIAVACHRLAALPHHSVEVRRSGEWATVRYARKHGKPVVICHRDGRVEP